MKRKAVVGIVLLALLVAGGMIYLLYSGTGGGRFRAGGGGHRGGVGGRS